MQIIQSIWNFFQNQLLGMAWLNDLIGAGLSALGLDLQNRWVGSLHFFLYDTVKITVLLCFLIFLISYIQSYFPPSRSKKILGRFHGIGANLAAALLGTVTPFCSCSSIPLFIGFSSAGLPIGVTFSFLISSPMVDLASLLLLTSIFGVKIAVIYVILGLVIAVIGGLLIEKLHMEKHVEDFVLSAAGTNVSSPNLNRKDRISFAKQQTFFTFKKVFPYILVGVAIGACIHNWLPEHWIAAVLGSGNPFAVILATLIGIPMYADIFGTIPIAEVLLSKGAQLGAILALMMAVTTLSLPSMIMLRKTAFWHPNLCKEFTMKNKPKVAFICVHNSCRSQMAEALGRHLASEVFESYSAGTEVKPQINQDAVRLMKKLYGINMEERQHSKLLADIPPVDIVITMGCNVNCPFLPCSRREDWGLDDPSGKSDDEFLKTIKLIETKIRELAFTLR